MKHTWSEPAILDFGTWNGTFFHPKFCSEPGQNYIFLHGRDQEIHRDLSTQLGETRTPSGPGPTHLNWPELSLRSIETKTFSRQQDVASRRSFNRCFLFNGLIINESDNFWLPKYLRLESYRIEAGAYVTSNKASRLVMILNKTTLRWSDTSESYFSNWINFKNQDFDKPSGAPHGLQMYFEQNARRIGTGSGPRLWIS